MVVGEVASLALALRVEESVFVDAVPRVLVPTVFAVAGGAHVLGVVLSLGVGAFCDKHNFLA